MKIKNAGNGLDRSAKKILSLVLSLAMICTMFTAFGVSVSAETTGSWADYTEIITLTDGYGATVDNPILITTAGQLAFIAQKINVGTASWTSPQKYYRLENDLDLSAHEWVPIGCGNPNGSSYPFGGYFDGNNKTITGVTINQPTASDPMGLFGIITDSTVDNLTLKNVNITGNTYVGGLAGLLQNNKTKINDCFVSGTVNGYQKVGGFAGGSRYATVLNCSSSASPTATDGNVGGFVGSAFASSFENCFAKGNAIGTWAIGGFVGTLWYGSKTDSCFSTGNVTGSDWRVGGFAGVSSNFENDAGVNTISNCYSTGNVTNSVVDAGYDLKTGGFIGEMQTTDISNCFSKSKVTGGNPSGGFLAFYESGAINNCYFDSTVNSGLNGVGKNGKDTLDVKAKSTLDMNTANFASLLGSKFIFINNEVVLSSDYLVNRNVITENDGQDGIAVGNSPVSATASIPSPTYTVTIPATVNFSDQTQALEKYKNETNDQFGKAVVVSEQFTVSATGVKNLFNDLDDGKADYINVTASFDGTLKGTNNTSNTVPYTINQNGTAIATGDIIATFYNDIDLASNGKQNTAKATILMNRANIKNADSYTGTMTFTIAVADR